MRILLGFLMFCTASGVPGQLFTQLRSTPLSLQYSDRHPPTDSWGGARTFDDLLDRPHEPPACRDDPKSQRARSDDGDGDKRMVQRLGTDGVKHRETKHDGYEHDPEHRGARY